MAAVTAPKPVTIYGREIVPQIGSYIEPDRWSYGNKLVASDWDEAQFRLLTQYRAGGAYTPTPSGYVEVAVNVEVTGRTLQRRKFGLWVRVRITFVGDCEPDETVSGWMIVENL